MGISKDELQKISSKQLIQKFERSVVLDAKNNGNDESSSDTDELRSELERRLGVLSEADGPLQHHPV